MRHIAGIFHALEEFAHLITGLEVNLRRVADAPLVMDVRIVANADHHVMSLVILLVEEMHVVRGHGLEAELLAESPHLDHALLLRVVAVIVHLKVEILLPEDLDQLRNALPGLADAVLENELIDLAFAVAAQADQTRCVFRESLPVHAGQGMHSVKMRLGHELHQVRVALVILRQQRQVGHGFAARDLPFFIHRSGHHIDLAADDRFDLLLLGLHVELNGPEEVPVVRDRHRRHPQFLHLRHQLGNAHRAIEKGVFRVKMKMDERGGHGAGQDSEASGHRKRCKQFTQRPMVRLTM